MIQLKTMLNCIDNSGAAIVECINLLKRKRPARVGDRIVVVVQKQRSTIPESGGSSTGSASSAAASAASKVRRGDVRHAVVVRAAKELRRADGSSVRFDDNACVLVSKAGEPIGSRVTGAVAAELRYKGWARILALAPAHV